MRLNTYSWGHSGGSPIVCVHGVAGHPEHLRKLAEDTLADRQVLALDLRGHGRSGWEPPWNLETHVADLAQTATAHAVEHATWIGFSLGGRLVAELALTDRRLVDRLVLLEPVLHLPPRGGADRGGARAPRGSLRQGPGGSGGARSCHRVLHAAEVSGGRSGQ